MNIEYKIQYLIALAIGAALEVGWEIFDISDDPPHVDLMIGNDDYPWYLKTDRDGGLFLQHGTCMSAWMKREGNLTRSHRLISVLMDIEKQFDINVRLPQGFASAMEREEEAFLNMEREHA
jgi:hypothetical protein